jgi:ADP-ribose pyrophosphatase
VSGSFRPIDETEIFNGHVISLVTARFESPTGEVFEREIVRHPGAVSVVPLDADGTVIMVRQYRAALDVELLELPAGKRDVADEPPELTARRELAEEIGMIAGTMELLGRFLNSPGFCDEESWVFLARDLEPVPSEAHGIEEEHMTVEHVPFDEVPAMIVDGRLIDGKSIIGLLLARQRVGGG